MKDDPYNTNSTVDRRIRRARIANETGWCAFCRPHGGENARKHPKPDKYKSRRKGRC